MKWIFLLGFFFLLPESAGAQAALHLRAAQPNDNRTAAGSLSRSVLRVSLDARVALWYPDGKGGSAIPIQTFSETGKVAQIPGPLIRVPAGTLVIATVHNAISGSALSVHGMVDRPTNRDRAVRIPFGKTRVIRFHAGAPGTYLYWGSMRAGNIHDRVGADSQLNGAIVVDPAGSKGNVRDRIFVVSQWINVLKKDGRPDFNFELDAINGLAWPHTERLAMNRGDTVHWRWINASLGGHPLHLHGYYFSVDSRGNGLADNAYAASERDHVVTELVRPGSTFTLTWHADRPGNWLFHCHLTYHTLGHVPIATMLAGKETISNDRYETDFVRHAGMGGLILGFSVHDRGRGIAAQSPAVQHVHLRVQPAADDRPDTPSFRYVVGNAPVNEAAAIGPAIILTRGVSTAIDVTNALNEATAVHWHGIELADSYYDGVMGISGYGKRVAPMIEPGQTFGVRMTPPRAGTFIYHTHMDDVWQLRGGLAGPLIVLEPGTTFNPASDHVFMITTTHKLSDDSKIFVNGEFSPPAITCRAGVTQRFRFINMTTFWTHALVSLSTGGRTVMWRPYQLDGAYVAAARRVPGPAVQMISIGETRDFTFTPDSPGELQLQFWPDKGSPNVVTVPVHVISRSAP